MNFYEDAGRATRIIYDLINLLKNFGMEKKEIINSLNNLESETTSADAQNCLNDTEIKFLFGE